MLALTRKVGESIVIGDDIEITVAEVKGDHVRLGINAPKSVKILRKEIFEEVQRENRAAAKIAIDFDEDGLRELGSVMMKYQPREK